MLLEWQQYVLNTHRTVSAYVLHVPVLVLQQEQQQYSTTTAVTNISSNSAIHELCHIIYNLKNKGA